MAKKTLAKQGALIGLGLAALTSIVAYLITPLFNIFYRDATAHLFPISRFIWAIISSAFGNIITPNMVSYTIVQLLIFVPFVFAGWLSGKLLEKKNKNGAILALAITGMLWIYVFYLLSRPMTGMH